MKRWIGSMKIGAKLISGFLLVALIAGIVGGIGIIGLKTVGSSYKQDYTDTVAALEYSERIDNSFQKIRAYIYKIVLTGSVKEKQDAVSSISEADAAIQENAASFRKMLANYPAEEVSDELSKIGELEAGLDAYKKTRDELINGLAMDPARQQDAYAFLNEKLVPLRDAVDTSISAIIQINETRADDQIAANSRLTGETQILMAVCVAAGVLLAVLTGLLIARDLSRRIGVIVGVTNKLSRGELDVEIALTSKDELGVLAETSRNMADSLKTIITDLSMGFAAFADGNFSVDTQAEDYYVGAYLPLMDSLRKMRNNLSDTLRHIDAAAEQVATGSDQVSSGAQALASGSTEQASAVEELNAAITQVAEEAAENLSSIGDAARDIERAGTGVASSNEYMRQLSEAMTEIKTSSGQISNITKVIEDIAFQTNILALNAAIEAARAGTAGKGFAVVADEVRNLAAKSAEAAHQTTELIAASVATVERGTQITERTAQALQETGANAQRVTESFSRIEHASTAQSAAIEQIKEGLGQISSVVQTNAATAEENSATSEEMSAQAVTLRQEVGKFKLWEGSSRLRRSAEAARIPAASGAPDEGGGKALGADSEKTALPAGMGAGKY